MFLFYFLHTYESKEDVLSTFFTQFRHLSLFPCQIVNLIVYSYRNFVYSSKQQFVIFQTMVLKTLKGLVYHFDMFCSTQLLRYNSETQYKTLTGGLLSLAIICVIAGGFFNMVTDTFKYTQITASLTTIRQIDPPLATLIPGAQNMFMLGLSIRSFDLSYQANLAKGPQYFTILMNIAKVSKGSKGVFSHTIVPLEPCTKEHWKMIPQFFKVFDDFGVQNWMCVPVGFPLPIQGTFVSETNQQISIEIYPCNNKTSNNSCASQQQIDKLFQTYQNFYLNLNYINPVISSIQQEYISYHNEISDYIIFSRKIGSEAWLYFSDYTINSDDSIWPYPHNIVEEGCIVEQKLIAHPYIVTPKTPLASVFLAKSTNSLVYDREVQKISAVFSYVGGLVGAITAFLFLVKSYTDSSLEVAIGIKLFQALNNDKQTPQNFHFISYIRLAFHRILNFFGWSKTSQYSEQLSRYQQEAVRQLDVQILLKRLIKVQSLINRFFTAEQLAQIREKHPITVDNAKKMRSLLLIQQVQSLQVTQKSQEMAEATLEGQQELVKYQQSKKKTTKDLNSSFKNRDVGRENTRHDQRPRQKQLYNPSILNIQGEADSSTSSVLKRVRIMDKGSNGQQKCFEIVSSQPMHQFAKQSHNEI